jgi:DNA (cytosine-5)-methyltransferase 1
MGLESTAKMYPTPHASCHTGASDSQEGSPNLQTYISMFPTPTTPRPHDSESTAGKYMPSQNQKDLTHAVAKEGGQLNPDWVEWLMGVPVGWTALDIEVEYPEPPVDGEFWPNEPMGVPRVVNNILNRVDRLKSLGNMVVPPQFYPIYRAINEIERGAP